MAPGPTPHKNQGGRIHKTYKRTALYFFCVFFTFPVLDPVRGGLGAPRPHFGADPRARPHPRPPHLLRTSLATANIGVWGAGTHSRQWAAEPCARRLAARRGPRRGPTRRGKNHPAKRNHPTPHTVASSPNETCGAHLGRMHAEAQWWSTLWYGALFVVFSFSAASGAYRIDASSHGAGPPAGSSQPPASL